MTFECHGVVFAVESADTAALDALPIHLPPGTRASDARSADVRYVVTRAHRAGPGRETYAVTRETVRGDTFSIARVAELGPALEELAQDAEFQVACVAPRDVFVHAGVVALDGRALVFPGYSFAGKSTLVAALVREGAAYYSDEYAVITRDGSVTPFARRIATRDQQGGPGPRLRPEDIGGVAGVAPLPIGAVITTRYRAGATWRPEALTKGQIALTLLEHAVTARTRPVHTLGRISAALAGSVVGLRGERGPAGATAHEIMNRLRHAGDRRLGSEDASRRPAVPAAVASRP